MFWKTQLGVLSDDESAFATDEGGNPNPDRKTDKKGS